MGACHPTASNTAGVSVEKMEGFPSADTCFVKGVSALYAGVCDGQLIMAGGCNFPHVPVADGGKKVYYDGIYAVIIDFLTTIGHRHMRKVTTASHD